ncbi:MAG: GSCFA domain-containing protein [Flavitalea sp.]
MRVPEHKFMLDLPLAPNPERIDIEDPILMIGSCFTENIGHHLMNLKFNVLQNPNGILFDPLSVASSLVAYTKKDHYRDLELFEQNGIWSSWLHHGRFSGVDKENVHDQIRNSQNKAFEFLSNAKWLIITLGTSFHYRILENNLAVANCHKVPASTFRKHLLSIEEINTALDNCLHQVFHYNKEIRVIFTVSPVRHIKDGIIENNRSKARLLEVVHHLVNKFDRLYYFPAYELVIDILRDYRFYAEDMVHPSSQATSFVTDKFFSSFINERTNIFAEQVQQILSAANHRAIHPTSEQHQQFLIANLEKIKTLKVLYPSLDLSSEENYFRESILT